jgi:hypothetical protein
MWNFFFTTPVLILFWCSSREAKIGPIAIESLHCSMANPPTISEEVLP